MTKKTNKNKKIIAGQSNDNHLIGKVVLLISNDTIVLPALITQLAQKGADIALVCQQLSQETVRRMKESVESLGRHFLLISDRGPIETSTGLIQTVIDKLDHLDLFIDLSGRKNDQQQAGNGNENPTEWFPPNWKLIYSALEEITA